MKLFQFSWLSALSAISLFGHGQDSLIYTFAEVMPQFATTRDSIQMWMRARSKFPMPVYREGSPLGGPFKRVVLNFVVNADGTTRDFRVAHSDNKELNTEAIRVAESLPRFIPGRQQGKAVPVYYNLIMLYE